ncbi:MAG: hypothetical protein MJ087_01855 [Lachnospiraceae bacterium]|nr:hypothetical protein [Lachnospiraceae bacterium]
MINIEQEIKKYNSFDKEAVKKIIFKEAGSESDGLLKNKFAQVEKRYGLALNYCNTDSFDLAFIQIKKVARLVPEYVDAQILSALICLHEGKADQAMEAVETALKYDANNKDALALKEELTVVPEVTEEAEGQAGEAKDGEAGEKTEKPAKMKMPAMKLGKKKEEKKETEKPQVVKPVTPVQAPKKVVANGSDYEEVTSNKKSFIYLGIGFLIGIIAMFILVVPTARSSVKNQYANEAESYEDQLKAKDIEIENLKVELKDAQKETKAAKKLVKTYKGSNKNLSLAAKEYMNNNNTLSADALLGVDKSTLSNKESKDLYDLIKSKTFTKAADQFYHNGLNKWYQKNYKEAIECYKKAIICDDSKSEYKYYLGLAYDASGEKDKAVKQYNKVINAGGKHAKDAKDRVTKIEEAKKAAEASTEKEATTEKED